MLKKLLLTLFFVASVSYARADADDMYMHIALSDGSVMILNTDEVHRITFNDGNLKASDKSDNVLASIPTKIISTMVFNESEESGLNSATVANGITLNGNRLTLNGEKADFIVYNTDGKAIINIPALSAGSTVDVSALSTGIYVVKHGNSSIKLIVK